MGLRKKVFYPKHDRKLTEEEQKKYDQAWEILCEKGSVCITDPSQSVESITDILKRDPNAFTGAHCDYHSDIPLSNYIKMTRNEKR